ncbi:tetratricopeptide (TPR) repeat protein [Clostridium acetobutylicum]|uniref:TPR repeats containing protein n=1 Tax=Clostridium acetobutylicum (strain ATCC 824 / DSM 792 / JCM 1419 / IAM 19013 / LMG 5710 / NBRC 13948 / NRRL B-527 / VKM B-1787 / 2291 / W) TaxID=272562 RepID=Q97M74_CLOAB|nr:MULTISPECIES: helix-turn-helix transcriptional regulator [Clostridium]AAK78305.1 TPR repeats containing protein [Clostridium acetobutylicum ATCC 824]ADZ19374.1 TPR repeats containing protein [Clostridium acetobutylicum EA 2018]AEI31170.1 TPR repeat-containing protein [Clostridium acetobutylicum DSM 1731]AWV80030.1 XRE family transcriptional regulator [Clostridium acetobutylicum]MBC2395850.1 helix-turn-helix transcriptional regulator [Clostridium acetobutylicum]
MGNCQILSSGDKIKLIRKKYGLRQDDIVGEEVTRNLISQIEHNKAKLTKSTAEIIIKNLKEIAKKNNLEMDVTADYLLEDELAQANSILENYVDELKNLLVYKCSRFYESLKSAEEFLIQWDIKEKKVQIYELAGDYFYIQNDLAKSVLYYEKAFDILDKTSYNKSLLSILRKLSLMYLNSLKYDRSIECCNFALNHFKNMPDDYISIFLFNTALCYYYMHYYEKALEVIDNLEPLIKDNTSKLIDVLNNKACCLSDLNRIDEAAEIYLRIFNLLNTNNIKSSQYLLILSNLIDTFAKKDVKDEVIKYLNLLLDRFPTSSQDDSYLSVACFNAAKAFIYLGDLQKAEEYLLKALTLSKNHNKYSLQEKTLSLLTDLYIQLNDFEKLEEINLEAVVLSNSQQKVCTNIFYKLLKFLNQNNKTEDIDKILNFLIKFK